MAISAQMCDQVQTLVRAARGPEPLLGLDVGAAPYVDLRRAIETEAHFLDLALPELRDVDNPAARPPSGRPCSTAWRENGGLG